MRTKLYIYLIIICLQFLLTLDVIGGPQLPPSVRYKYTGSQQTYVVPRGVTYLELDVVGAQGGSSTVYSNTGGGGARVQTVISVTPGETVYINVGGATGWPNGGSNSSMSIYGGGSSDVRQGGNELNNIVAIAGGGGACAIGVEQANGGAGGETGENGQSSVGDVGGRGATQSSGGAGGGDGTAGSFFQGGNGGPNITGVQGGGGGGGYYGGGGGGNHIGYGGPYYSGGGGGGASSYAIGSPIYTTGYNGNPYPLAPNNGYVLVTPTNSTSNTINNMLF